MSNNTKLEIETLHFKTLPIIHKVFCALKFCTVFYPHWHKRYEIIHIISGQLQITIGNKVLNLETDDICFINTQQAHSGISLSDDLVYEIIQIDYKALEVVADIHKDIKSLLNHKISIKNSFRDSDITKLFSRIADLYKKANSDYNLLFMGMVLELLGIMLLKHKDSTIPAIYMNEQFLNILKYIDSHYTEELSIVDIANHFSYHSSYFSRRFKEVIGIPPNQYLCILRLKASEDMLIKTNDSIEIISQKCGFESSNYFIRKFKNRYALSPLQYRRLYQKKN